MRIRLLLIALIVLLITSECVVETPTVSPTETGSPTIADPTETNTPIPTVSPTATITPTVGFTPLTPTPIATQVFIRPEDQLVVNDYECLKLGQIEKYYESKFIMQVRATIWGDVLYWLHAFTLKEVNWRCFGPYPSTAEKWYCYAPEVENPTPDYCIAGEIDLIEYGHLAETGIAVTPSR